MNDRWSEHISLGTGEPAPLCDAIFKASPKEKSVLQDQSKYVVREFIAVVVLMALLNVGMVAVGGWFMNRSDYRYVTEHCTGMGGFIAPDGSVFNCQPRIELLQPKKEVKK